MTPRTASRHGFALSYVQVTSHRALPPPLHGNSHWLPGKGNGLRCACEATSCTSQRERGLSAYRRAFRPPPTPVQITRPVSHWMHMCSQWALRLYKSMGEPCSYQWASHHCQSNARCIPVQANARCTHTCLSTNAALSHALGPEGSRVNQVPLGSKWPEQSNTAAGSHNNVCLAANRDSQTRPRYIRSVVRNPAPEPEEPSQRT